MWEHRVEQVKLEGGPFGNALGFKTPQQSGESQLIWQLGQEGWELVSVVPLGGAFNGGRTALLQLYFKRWRAIQPA